MFVLAKLVQPSVNFSSKIRSLPFRGAPERCSNQAGSGLTFQMSEEAKILLSVLPWTNTLAYFESSSGTKKKKFYYICPRRQKIPAGKPHSTIQSWRKVGEKIADLRTFRSTGFNFIKLLLSLYALQPIKRERYGKFFKACLIF